MIDGGTGEQVNGNTVIFHDEDGTAGAGFLRLDTFPQLTSVGQVTPSGYSTPVPLLGQNDGLTETYLTLGGFGMGISPTAGVNPYPNQPGDPPVQFETGLTPPIYDGIEITDVENLELLLPSGGNTVQVDSVPSDLKLTVDPVPAPTRSTSALRGPAPRSRPAPATTRSWSASPERPASPTSSTRS